MRLQTYSFFVLCVLFQWVTIIAASQKIIYLSWVDDPTTSMVVQWIESQDVGNQQLVLYPLKEGGHSHYQPITLPIAGTKMQVQRVFLTELQEGSEYAFAIEENTQSIISQAHAIYKFKTLSKTLKHPVRFVVGGDIYYHYNLFRKMNASIAAASPDFVILGGDIAYAYFHGPPLVRPLDWQWLRWKTFLSCWREQMIDKEGRLIPLLAVVGNHDVRRKDGKYKNHGIQESLFYTLFPWKEEKKTYREFILGDYLAFFLLDSGHGHPIAGAQTEWLKHALERFRNISYKMAAYHIPAYPSYSSLDNSTSIQLRREWCPLFEEHHLQVAFSHHNHTYKRTKPILAGNADPQGVIHLGDGSWGAPPRIPKMEGKEWYIEQMGSLNAVFWVYLSEDGCEIGAMNNKGQIFDRVPRILPLKNYSVTSSSKTCVERSIKEESVDGSNSLCPKRESS